MKTSKTTFSWRNYTRPTPNNLLGLAAFLRRAVALVAGVTIVMEANMYVPLIILATGFLLDELKNFFANVAHDVEEATAQFPSGDVVTVTKEVKEEENLNKIP